MNPKIYRAPIAKFLGPLSIILSLAGFGFYLYLTEHSTIGLIAGVLSTIGILVVLIQLLPGANSLTLDAEGLTIRAYFRDQRYLWKDISGFRVGKIGLNELVVFNLTSEFKSQSEADRAASEFMRNINGFDAALPSNFGLSAAELSKVLNECLAGSWKPEAAADPVD